MAVNRLLEFTRGGDVNVLSANLLLYRNAPRVQILDPSADGFIVTLPDFQLLKKGGPHFYIVNISDTFTFTVESSNMQESFLITTEKAIVLSTFRDVGQKAWFANIRDFIGSAIGELAP